MTHIRITADEFLRRVIDGERQFNGTYLIPGKNVVDTDGYVRFDRSEFWNEFQNKNHGFAKDPVVFNKSQWENFAAPGLRLPYMKTALTSWVHASIPDAQLYNSVMPCSLTRIDASGATLSGSVVRAQMDNVNFERAHLDNVDFANSVFGRKAPNYHGIVLMRYALLHEAKFRDTVWFEDIDGLEEAHYFRTEVTAEQKHVIDSKIRAYRRKNDRFSVQ